MNLLLDTHTFLWIVGVPQKLSSVAATACQDRRNTLLLSVASIWEMQIKLQLGKLVLPDILEQIVQEQQRVNAIRILPIEPAHIYALDVLPLHHRDPFDRLLISQATVTKLTIVSADRQFAAYSVPLLW